LAGHEEQCALPREEQEMATATCDIRFSLQNGYASDDMVDALDPLGVSNAAVTISGRALCSEKEISIDRFLAADAKAIRTRFARFLEANRLPRPGDLVLLDLEPQGFAPRALGMFVEKPKELRKLVAAYRLRIRVARQELRKRKLPGLQLGLYQVIVPDGRGQSSDEFEQRMCGYREAGRRGMYDDLDFICPVLYQRFGPLDASAERLRRWLAAMTRQALDQSLTLTRRNGERIPLVPILSFWVLNGKSENDRDPVTPASIARQLRPVQDSAGIKAILFWSESEPESEMRTAKESVEAINIVELLDNTGVLPWPGCR
jgi:hypothetical protein